MLIFFTSLQVYNIIWCTICQYLSRSFSTKYLEMAAKLLPAAILFTLYKLPKTSLAVN
nr:MAG TPA: hypothetical protein [Caudoviricetes sp.]